MLSHFIAQSIDLASVVWACRFNGLQHVGYLPAESLQFWIDLDEFVAGLFADLAIYDGSLFLRLILPSGDLIEVSAETSVELGHEVMDVTFTGLVPDWLVGRWVP